MSFHVPAPGGPRETALRMAEHHEFAQAVQWLERALAADAGADDRQAIAGTLADVARLAEAAGELDVAQRALERATRTVEWADLHCDLGCLLVRRSRRAEARIEFDRALTINPRYRTAVVERALLDAREGRIAEAMQTLRVLAAEGALAEPGTFQQGIERLGRADFEDAAPLLRRALHSGDAWLEEQLHAYQEFVYAGEHARALATLRAAAAERPAYPDLQLLLGAHELQTGAIDDALESLVHALELHPEYHAARVELARALETLGDTPQALAQLDQVLAADPSHGEARTLHERLSSRRRGSRAGAGVS
jgi:tetratricopeptide (TPR) repeat protein